ncbi:MAG: leucine-rich repeat domain-containing protein, partial [Proteobacteria bacterium]|nr:leucine-rich repeat domain-containing protein [Pseudomonadota bacterium]
NNIKIVLGNVLIYRIIRYIYEYDDNDPDDYSKYICIGDTDNDNKSISIAGVYDDGLHGSHPVIGIQDSAFEDRNNIRGLTLNENLGYIGERAFYGCIELAGGMEGTTIPNSVKTIGVSAFDGCIKLTGTLTLPTGNNNFIEIPERAFAGCQFTGDLVIPDTVTTIGDSAFEGCNGFTRDLVIPETVTTIGDSAFQGCDGFTGDLVIPDSIETIGISAFDGCTGLNGTLTLSTNENFTEIPLRAFADCGFSGMLAVPLNVLVLGESAFVNCGFNELIIHGGVTSLGSNVWQGCENISRVTHFGAGNSGDQIKTIVNDIGNGAQVLTLYVGSDVTFGDDMSDNVTTSIFNRSLKLSMTPDNDDNIKFSMSDDDVDSLTENEKANMDLSLIDLIINDHISDYTEYTWIVSESILNLLTPHTLDNVDDNTKLFIKHPYVDTDTMDNLITYANWDGAYYIILSRGSNVSITVGNQQTMIERLDDDNYKIGDINYEKGESTISDTIKIVFGGVLIYTTLIYTYDDDYNSGQGGQGGYICEGGGNPLATTINIPDEYTDGVSDGVNLKPVFKISQVAFNGRTSIKKLTLGTIKIIDGSAFEGCTGIIGDLVIPDSVTAVESRAFFGCTGFTGDLVIPDSVTAVKPGAFYGCTGFTSLKLPANDAFITIQDGSFADCEGMTGTLTIPDSVTTIEPGAFYGCIGFTGLKLPENNEFATIGEASFAGCERMIGILTIPDSVTTIEQSAFYGCIGFTGLSLSNNLLTIGSEAFSACAGMEGVLTIPDSVTGIGNGAFLGCIFSELTLSDTDIINNSTNIWFDQSNNNT